MDLVAIAGQVAIVAKDWVGIVLPFFIDIVNRRIPNTNWRFVVSLLICLIVASLFNLPELVSGDVSIVLGKIGLIFTQAQVVYKLYWQNSATRQRVIGEK